MKIPIPMGIFPPLWWDVSRFVDDLQQFVVYVALLPFSSEEWWKTK